MRIQSPFKDYYDKAQGLGSDMSLFWKREPVVHTREVSYGQTDVFSELFGDFCSSPRVPIAGQPSGPTKPQYVQFSPFAVLLAGKVHKGYQIGFFDKPSIYGQASESASRVLCVYQAQALMQFLTEHNLNPQSVLKAPLWRVPKGNREKELHQWFAATQSKALLAWALDKSIPLAYVNTLTKTWTENPNLSTLSFGKTMDATAVFQEIAMFLGGVVSRAENATLSISDKDRIAQHGFDEYSFRRAPSSKKRK